MNIKPGTRNATALLKQLSDNGKLVDIYSCDWYANRDADGFLANSFLQDLISEHGTDFLNHLIIICAASCSYQEKDALRTIYLPLQDHLNCGNGEADFIILNLFRREALVLGLNSMNRLFAVILPENKSVNAFNLTEGTADLSAFIEFDYGEFVMDLACDLSELGEALTVFMSTPGNIETVAMALDTEPDRDGMHYIDGDDEGYSKRQLMDFLDAHQSSDQRCKDALMVIQALFPSVDSGDFNN